MLEIINVMMPQICNDKFCDVTVKVMATALASALHHDSSNSVVMPQFS